ncbi:MAG: hypothetical protein OXC37_02220 [Bdellovibrionaceae bacterium]|nr:hypothetical protein [Pseudobdellovibrionaceae bacterium]
MVVEYLLMLLISTLILAGSFGLNTGPVKMFQLKSPSLAYLIESNLETGQGFKPPGDWE